MELESLYRKKDAQNLTLDGDLGSGVNEITKVSKIKYNIGLNNIISLYLSFA